MIVDPHYWSWTSELPDGVCDQIVDYGLSLKDEQGQAGGDVQIDMRKSRISWVPVNHWISGIVSHYACLLYTSPSPRDVEEARMPSSA